MFRGIFYCDFALNPTVAYNKQLWEGGVRRNLYLQGVCDTSLARTTGFLWLRAEYGFEQNIHSVHEEK